MQKKDLIYYAIVIILLVACLYLISLLKGEAGQCVKAPLTYGARSIGNVTCMCSKFISNSAPAKFIFNDDNISVIP